MKKAIITALIGLASMIVISCGNSSNNTETKTHTHDDGSTHADHDTTKPAQQEFTVGDSTASDTTAKEHTHKDGEKHSH
jgi:hypothetical protein